MRIFFRLKFPTDHHTVPCHAVRDNNNHTPYAIAYSLEAARNLGPRALFPGFGDGATSKARESALATRLGAARNLVPRAPVRGLKHPAGDEVGLHGPHQSKYTETGRPRIQRYVRQLIWAPDVNDFGQTKKVYSRGYIYFITLASLFAHQNVVRVFIALECYNRKNFHRLIMTFHERKFFLFRWQRAPLFVLAYLWPTKRSGMWPREFFFLAWQTKPRGPRR